MSETARRLTCESTVPCPLAHASGEAAVPRPLPHPAGKAAVPGSLPHAAREATVPCPLIYTAILAIILGQVRIILLLWKKVNDCSFVQHYNSLIWDPS